MNFNFDFVNVDDIQSEDLRSRFESEVAENIKRVAGILNAPSCPGPLTCAQVAVVYCRAYGEEQAPKLTTFRSWLNKAKASGLISKPTKQTYGKAGLESVQDDDDAVEDPAAVDYVDLLADPLA